MSMIPGFGGPYMLAPSLVPANHAELIRSAMAANRKPQVRAKLSADGGMECSDTGSTGMLYTAGVLSIISIDGLLSMGEDPFSWLFGGCSMTALAQAIREAADDPHTKATLFDVHSPGGTCSGNSDVQAAVRYHKTRKPLHAIAHDTAASGAYYAIARCDEIVCLSSSMLGSIGVLSGPYFDVTAALEKDGIDPWFGRTGDLKGAGMTGIKASDAMRAQAQRNVEALAADFFQAVAEGRRMSVEQVRAMQAGVYGAADAVKAGLADRMVASFQDYVAELQIKYAQAPAVAPSAAALPRSPKPAAQESSPMSGIDWSKVTAEDVATMPADLKAKAGIVPKVEEPKPEGPASNVQLKAEFPDDAAFRGKALDAGWTISEARREHTKALAATNAALEAKNKELEGVIAASNQTKKDVVAVLGAPPTGAAPVSASAKTGPSDYESAIRNTMRTNPGMSRFQATSVVNEKQPELRQAWLESQIATSGKRK